MKYIARKILWCVDHATEIMLASLPFLLAWLLYALKYALECAMW